MKEPADRGRRRSPALGIFGGALAVGLATAGCVHAPPVARPYPAPTGDALAGLLATRATTVHALNARARATSWLGGERVRATVLMLVERDGHLRFEAEVSLQGTVATLATDGRTFALLDARKNELSRGPACPSNVASLVRIPLAPADVAAIVLGDARCPPEAAVSPTVAWTPRAAPITELEPAPTETLHVFWRGHGAAVDIVGAEALAGGKPLWRTAYEDFQAAGAARVPTMIRFAEASASYDDGVEIASAIASQTRRRAPAAFTLTAPPASPSGTSAAAAEDAAFVPARVLECQIQGLAMGVGAKGLSIARQYAKATVVSIAVTLGRLRLDPWLGHGHNRHLFFLPTVMVIAWLWGFGPALLGAALFSVALRIFWTDATESFIHANSDILLFALVSAAICLTIRSLQHARQRAGRRPASREQLLLAVVAHDLTNPLHAVKLAEERLRSTAGESPSIERSLRTIRHATTRMDHLLRDLVDSTRIEHEELVVTLRSEPVAPIVQEVAFSSRPRPRSSA